MILRSALMFAISSIVSHAAVRSGRASADWLAASHTVEAGRPVQTALRLVVDEHWHTYWINPGESGTKLAVKWDLPPGWTAGEVGNPVPKRFVTGELAGFGYEGTVMFPVVFTPPAGFSGSAKLKGKVSWLTCDDNACIPGSANLELDLEAGAPAATEWAGLIDGALAKVPRPAAEGASLDVVEKPETLVLTVTFAAGKGYDLKAREVFPATPQVVDSAAKFQFTEVSGQWTAEVAKSEYLAGPLEEFTLVIGGGSPVSLSWTAKK